MFFKRIQTGNSAFLAICIAEPGFINGRQMATEQDQISQNLEGKDNLWLPTGSELTTLRQRSLTFNHLCPIYFIGFEQNV